MNISKHTVPPEYIKAHSAPWKEVRKSSSEWWCRMIDVWYHPTKFQLNQIRTSSNPGQGGGMCHMSSTEVSSTVHLPPQLNLMQSPWVGCLGMWCPSLRCMTNARDLPQLSVENWVYWVSKLQHSQKSGDLGAGGSVGVGTSFFPPNIFNESQWNWSSPELHWINNYT